PDPQGGGHAAHRLDGAQAAQGVERLDRVVVVLALVVDAAHPGPQQEVLVGQDLVPEGLHLGDLGEEPVAADVEPPPVALDGAGGAADLVGRLEHGAGTARLRQLVGGGEPGGAGSDDHHVAGDRQGRVDGTGVVGGGGGV